MTELIDQAAFLVITALCGAHSFFGACFGAGRSESSIPIAHGVAEFGCCGVRVSMTAIVAYVSGVTVGKTGGISYGGCVIVSGCVRYDIRSVDLLNRIGISVIFVTFLAEPVFDITVLLAGLGNSGEVSHLMSVIRNRNLVGFNTSNVIAYAVYSAPKRLTLIFGANLVGACGLAFNGYSVNIPLIRYVIIVGYVKCISYCSTADTNGTFNGKSAGKYTILCIIGHIRSSFSDLDVISVSIGPTNNGDSVVGYGCLRNGADLYNDVLGSRIYYGTVVYRTPKNEGDSKGFLFRIELFFYLFKYCRIGYGVLEGFSTGITGGDSGKLTVGKRICIGTVPS